MFCKKCGNEIREGENFCRKCGTKTKSINGVLVFIVVLILIIFVCSFLYLIKRKSDNFSISKNGNDKETNLSNSENSDNEEINGFVQASSNIALNNAERVSFENMDIDDEKLSKIQKDIISYFDTDYFQAYFSDFQKYPQIFKNVKITTTAKVLKVLKSTDEEFEVLAIDCAGLDNCYWEDDNHKVNIEDIPEEQLLLISGKQQNERLLTYDMIKVYGKYIDVENKEIDGKSYILPKIEVNNFKKGKFTSDDYRGYSIDYYKFSEKFSFEEIKNIAEYIFNKDIKVTEPSQSNESDYYKITLDNQSNSNFKTFNIYKNNGLITYDIEDNDLTENIQKKLFISADFQHYIVSTYDSGTNHVYIDYFDKNYNKLWSREFNYLSTKAFVSPMDYNDKQMAIVVDNDLYLIDLETGKDIIEPIIVGEKIRVNMMADGIILIGDNNKDAIMKVDYTGKIIFKTNVNTIMDIFYQVYLQVKDEKLILYIWGYSDGRGWS